MLENKTTSFKTLILLKLTKQLIESTNSYGMYKLEKLLSSGDFEKKLEDIKKEKLSKEEVKEKLKKEVKEKLNYSPSKKIRETESFIVPIDERNKQKQIPKKRIFQSRQRPIPQPGQNMMSRQTGQVNLQRALHRDDLPENLQYLRPTKSETPLEIDLGKLNLFLQDRNVKTIETEGPDQMIFVTGTMGKKPTGIKFTKEEIDEVLDKFSKESKIPKTEGLFKVALGNILLTAMISESIGSRFIIKKI
ncbi:hypothetical protein GW932_00070 [archaeon]|nr:hypothetical protein [archaeon]